MIPFLKSIAKAYHSRYGDMSEFCFVFPNKRAGAFFQNCLRSEAADRPMLAPKITSISEMAEELSGRIVDNKTDLLFLLYKSYLRLGERNKEEDFNSFRAWGETALNDFGEIDMYGVSPREIFRNLKDFREISANYLTEEQRRVMEEYFGYRRGVEKDAGKFWKTFEPDSEIKGRFLHVWQQLAPLYESFEKELAERGLTTPSGAYRLTLERLRHPDAERPARKMVFIGFNALSLVEREIFKEMALFEDFDGPDGPEASTDFFWDGTGPVLNSTASDSSPSHFLRLNRRDFPEPEWARPFLRLSDSLGQMPDIRVVSAPSKAIQAKIVGKELERLNATLPASDFRQVKVAVVLPDESLLIPLLYSLPKNCADVNLTMGYDIGLTSAASFVAIYRMLQRGIRRSPGGPAFYHQHLRKFLGHPFVHAVAGSLQIAALNRWLNKSRRLLPTMAEISEIAPGVASLITPLPEKAGYRDAAFLITDTLTRIAGSLKTTEAKGVVKSRLDISHIDIYLDAIRRLLSSIEEHEIEMSASTFFLLADRMLSSEQVTFEGEPLRGLQVMGMLETRALDFERVIIPSANEKYLPVKGRSRSFIPNTLRAAYHIPPMQHQENLASYYFFRLLSRAKEAVIIYDSRTGNGNAGEPSRYIAQLRYLYAADKIRFENRTLSIAPDAEPIIEIRKSEGVMRMLGAYLDPKSKEVISATSLQTYCECGLRFFYERVAGIKTDTEPSEYIDSKTQGDVVHDVMMRLYLPEEKIGKLLNPGMQIDKKFISGLLDNPGHIRNLVRQAINKKHFHLQGDRLDTPLPRTSELVASNLERYVVNILKHDLTVAPFALLGCEVGSTVEIPLPGGRKVSFRFVIDRLDHPQNAGEENPSIRLVDYKTSSINQKNYSSIVAGELFAGSYQDKYPMQLMVYSEMLNRWLRERGEEEMPVRHLIYNITKMQSAPEITLMNDGTEVCHDGASADEFREGLIRTLEEIFDSSEPFKAPANPEEACTYCALGPLCKR